MSDDTYIPNSFQTPNFLIDKAMELLTEDEFKSLMFVIRHILGWKDKISSRRNNISLTMLCKGYGGLRGTGLSRPRAIRALNNLATYGFIREVEKDRKKGTLWELNEAAQIDWNALEERAAKSHAAGYERTQKARERAIEKASGQTDIPSVAVRHSDHERSDTLTMSGQTDIPSMVRVSDRSKPSPQTHSINTTTNTAPHGAVSQTPSSKSNGQKPDKATMDALWELICLGSFGRPYTDIGADEKRVGKIRKELLAAAPRLTPEQLEAGYRQYAKECGGKPSEDKRLKSPYAILSAVERATKTSALTIEYVFGPPEDVLVQYRDGIQYQKRGAEAAAFLDQHLPQWRGQLDAGLRWWEGAWESETIKR